jgi:antagonist of KipI
MSGKDMSAASMRVITPGLHTTVQDLGRWGFQSYGVSVSGAMDQRSHRTANALVGNDPCAATLEVTLVGPELEFEDVRLVVVSGALFDLAIDGRTIGMNSPIAARPGSRLTFGARSRGARAYVAVAGGVASPPVFGSRATHVGSRMGGLEGRALLAGDRLPLGPPPDLRPRSTPGRPLEPDARTLPSGHARIRVLPGPQHDRFAEDALEALQSQPYAIQSQSDRMGFRLTGPLLRHRQSAEIISDATPLGALQVPSSGQPMLLMADRQTTGGYPKIATVIAADISVAAQLAPGDRMSFEVCALRDAMAALIAEERALMALEARA